MRSRLTFPAPHRICTEVLSGREKQNRAGRSEVAAENLNVDLFSRQGSYVWVVRRAVIAVARIDFRDLGVAYFCVSIILRVRQSATPSADLQKSRCRMHSNVPDSICWIERATLLSVSVRSFGRS